MTRDNLRKFNNGKDNLRKFDSKLDETIFFDYSTTSKTFRIFNKPNLIVKESIHFTFDESKDLSSKIIARNEDVGIDANMKDLEIN